MGLKAGDERLNAVKIRNPLGEDTSQMRTSLVPSMLSTLAMNLHRGNAEARMFETAPIFLPRQAGELPEERLSLCIGMYGEAVDFFALKQAVEELLFVFGVSLKIEKGADGYYHPGRSAHYGTIAQLGEIHPDVRRNSKSRAACTWRKSISPNWARRKRRLAQCMNCRVSRR